MEENEKNYLDWEGLQEYHRNLETKLSEKANTEDLADVATSGDYNDLDNTPTNVSQFTNDVGYMTSEIDNTNGHDYVEIGGIKWATMNVGASKITDIGLYFQWGDILGYTSEEVGVDKNFTWEDYKFNPSGDGTTFSKYNSTDLKTSLDTEDDAAANAWGSDWRVPSTSELQTLSQAVNISWTDNYQESGVPGLILTDKEDSSKFLFLPATGVCNDGSIIDDDTTGFYWSKSLGNTDDKGLGLGFDKTNGTTWEYSNSRSLGFAIRPVLEGPAKRTIMGVTQQEKDKWNSKVSGIKIGESGEVISPVNGVVIIPNQSNVQADWNQTDSTAGDYIKNKPTIPSVGNAEIEIQKNGTKVGSFTTNQSGSKVTMNITVPTGTAANKDVPTSGNASTSQVVMGNDSRLTDSRNAKDVYSWAKASSKPTYTASEVEAIPTSAKGAASGVATLDSAGKVPASQLPSYVDDVLEYNNKASFPTTGETGKIYIDKATNLTWRWGGSTYVEISPSLALGETSSTAYAGDKGKALADKLATIAEGAEVNVQSDWNATSGDAFIKNKPTIPAAVTESTVSGWGFTKNAGTITGIKMNGSSKGTSGVVDLGTVITNIKASAGSHINEAGTPSVTASTASGVTTFAFDYLKGAQGPKGDKGDTGSNGSNGTNGTSAYWFSGTAVTGTATSGISATVSGSKAGDMYLNTSTYNVYKATAANTWGYICNIKGAAGSNGTNGTNGTSAYWFTGTAVTGTGTGISASVSNSKAGDMYLNTSTQNVYTATAANKWNYVCNIKGAAGQNATTTSVFSTSANGLAPAASSGNKTTAETAVSNYYLCADGKYRQLPANAFKNDNTWTAASTSAAGYVPAAIKGKFLHSNASTGNLEWVNDNNTTYTPQKLGTGIGTCSTSSGTDLTVSLTGYELVQNGFVAVTFANDVPAGATLNINSKGAKPIIYKGSAIEADTIKADDTVMFAYDGTNYVVTSLGGGGDVELVEYLSINLTCNLPAQASDLIGATVVVTDEGNSETILSTTWQGTALECTIDVGISYTITVGSVTDYTTPSSKSFVAKACYTRTENFVYQSTLWVDLGLPSGTLWASRNLGANSYTDRGLYYSWGNIVGHAENSGYAFTDDYNNTPGHTLTASFTSGDPIYDAAAAAGKGRIPTHDECKELVDNCVRETETISGINFDKYTSKINGNIIRIRWASCYNNTSMYAGGNNHSYNWSSSIYPSDTALAYNLNWDNYNKLDYRYIGMTIRPVN